METNFTDFIKAACIRAAKTFFQTLASLVVMTGMATRIQDIEWAFALSCSVTAAVFSIITSCAAGIPEVPDIAIFNSKKSPEENFEETKPEE